MHMLGHGVIVSIIELTESIFTKHKLWSNFCRFATELLGDISAFRLEWCHIKSLPKTCWLAEDEFGYGRLMLFVYGQYFIQKTSRPTPCWVLHKLNYANYSPLVM